MPRKITRLPASSEAIRTASTPRSTGPLASQGVVFGRHLLALAVQLLGEEIVEHRPDHHYGPEEQHVVERRGDRGAQDVGPNLELEPQRQETPQVQPDLGVAVLPETRQGEYVPDRRRHGAEPYNGCPYRLDHQTQVNDRHDQALFPCPVC